MVAGVGAVSTVFVVGGPLAAAVFLVQEGAVAALTAVLFCCPTTVVLGEGEDKKGLGGISST